MSLDLPRGAAAPPQRPAILIVDDDTRVVELLEIAFQAHGYRIFHAADGDAGIECARREHPALVLLDVRLPRRSGYEVCEKLRQDPDDPHVPIVMVSAAAEVEARVQGLARGADDYVVKPFSPRELVARVERLLARSAEAREAQRSGRAAERELAKARADAERTHDELRRARRVAERAHALAATLEGCAEPAAIGEALLLAATRATGAECAALLTRDADDEAWLTVAAAHGVDRARLRGLAVHRRGELARLLAGLGRVVAAAELARLPELAEELPALTIAGFTATAALVSEDGLEGALLLGERPDGGVPEPAALEEVVALGEVAARALSQARRLRSPLDAAIDLMAALAGTGGSGTHLHTALEVADVVDHAARALALDAAVRRPVGWAVRLGPWMVGPEGGAQLECIARGDATGAMLRLRRLALAAHELVPAPGPDSEALPAILVALGWRARTALDAGLPPTLAWGRALADVAPGDPELATALRVALRSVSRGAA
jgi:DNA-binding response OmpR family regulator